MRLLLFLSAYVPLFAIFAIRFEDSWLRGGSAGLALAGFAAILWIRARRRRVAPQRVSVADVGDEGAAVAGYTATYLVPFVTVSNPSGRDVLAYGLLFAMLALVHVRTSMVQVNPMLYLMGRRVWRFTSSGGRTGYAIVAADTRLHRGLVAIGHSWGEDVWWVTEVEDE